MGGKAINPRQEPLRPSLKRPIAGHWRQIAERGLCVVQRCGRGAPEGGQSGVVPAIIESVCQRQPSRTRSPVSKWASFGPAHSAPQRERRGNSRPARSSRQPYPSCYNLGPVVHVPTPAGDRSASLRPSRLPLASVAPQYSVWRFSMQSIAARQEDPGAIRWKFLEFF